MLKAQNPSREARCESWLDPSLVSSPPLLNGISSHFELHAVFLDPLGGMETRYLKRYSNSRVTRDGKFSCIGTKATKAEERCPNYPYSDLLCLSQPQNLRRGKVARHIFTLVPSVSSVHISIWPKFNLFQKEMKKSKKRGDGEVIICRGNLSQVSGSLAIRPQRNWKSHEYHYPSLLEVREPANQGKIHRTNTSLI